MSELLARDFLRYLYHAGQGLLRGESEQAMESAIDALAEASVALTARGGRVVLSIVGDAFYLDKSMLANASTEFDHLLQAMRRRRIDSVTILPGTSRGDLFDLAAMAIGFADDLPADGTILLNEEVLSPSDVDMRPMSSLRRTYSDSLDALREVSQSRSVQMSEVLEIVDDFLTGGGGEAGSSLLMATVHNHDELTYYHSINVCLLSLALGRFAGLSEDQLRMLGLGAMLHDIGRVVVDEAALHRKGRLSNEDWAQVRLHPQEGALAILAASGPGHEVAAAVALEHHARPDGGGYPDIAGRAPHLYSRIVAVADTYEAITAHRPYRPARTPNEALQVLLAGAGKSHDADLVRMFIEMMGSYPPGSLLRLTTGEVIVVVPDEGSGRRGIVMRESDGNDVAQQRAISFTNEDIAAQLLPSEAQVDPGSVLEIVEQGGALRR